MGDKNGMSPLTNIFKQTLTKLLSLKAFNSKITTDNIFSCLVFLVF